MINFNSDQIAVKAKYWHKTERKRLLLEILSPYPLREHLFDALLAHHEGLSPKGRNGNRQVQNFRGGFSCFDLTQMKLQAITKPSELTEWTSAFSELGKTIDGSA